MMFRHAEHFSEEIAKACGYNAFKGGIARIIDVIVPGIGPITVLGLSGTE
jgi:hypothetical protein